MKSFSCGDVVEGCTARFEAESEEELLQQIAAHAKSDHGIDEVSPELVAKVRACIQPRA